MKRKPDLQRIVVALPRDAATIVREAARRARLPLSRWIRNVIVPIATNAAAANN